MANTLSREKQEAALRCLVDGASVRATERVVGVHRDAVPRLMVRVGQGCRKVMDAEMRGLRTRRIEVDEVWGYVGKKQRHLTPADDRARSGDFWTFVAFPRASWSLRSSSESGISTPRRPSSTTCPSAWPTGSSSPRMHLEPTSKERRRHSGRTWTTGRSLGCRG